MPDPRRLRRSLPLCLVTLSFLAGPGCVNVQKRSALDELETRLRAEERARSSAMQELEGRIRDLETRNAWLEGYLSGLGRGGSGGTGTPGASSGPGTGSGTGSVGLPPTMGPGPTRGAAPARGEAQRYGGVYRQALETNPPKLDPAHLEDTTSHRVGAQILEGLVGFGPELEPIPLIAESWQVSEDRRAYTFKLRSGVRFHHGREVEAKDFVFSFGRILDPKTASVRVWLFDRVLGYPLFSAYRRVGDAVRSRLQGKSVDWEALSAETRLLAAADAEHLSGLGHPDPGPAAALAAELVAWVGSRGARAGRGEAVLEADVGSLSSWDFLARGFEAPDPRTFVVRLEEPFTPFVSVLAMVNAAVVPREEVERLGEKFGFHPVGTGPFKFVSWEHDVSMVLEANDDYFAGRPYLDRLEFRIIPDEVTALIEFETGNLESMNRVPDEKYEQIKATKDYPGVLEEKPILHTFYLAMNKDHAPFGDLRVRKAFNHAVNRSAILNKIRKGRGQLAKGPLPPGIPGYDPGLEGYPYDPARAKALLAEAGFDPPGKLGTVDFWFNSSTGSDVNAKIAEVFQENLKQIGVDLRLNSVDWGTYLEKINRCEPPIARLAWVADYPDADNFMYVLFHSSTIGQSNTSCYRDPVLDGMLESARIMAEGPERVALYQKAQRKIVDEAIWIPVFHQKEPFLRKSWVRGAVLTGRGADAIRFKDVWLDRKEMEEAQRKRSAG